MSNTFVGFGFGPIQAGLFVHEALASGRFDRMVIAEIDEGLVSAVRAGGGTVTVNIAHPDGIRTVTHSGIEIYNPRVPREAEAVIAAVSEATELATAVPKVEFYRSQDGKGIDHLLREGLRRKLKGAGPRQAVVYAAENHNRAAEILQQEVTEGLSAEEACGVCTYVRFLNTVIGKMSQRVDDPREIAALGLGPIGPGSTSAFLVEAFRNILIARITLEGFERGITAFVEKPDLLPFEEAKLYGHNAVHALMGYLAALKGYECMSDIGPQDDILRVGRRAFLEESGATLIRRHSGVDALFTEEGYGAFGEDLLERMRNPYLRDTIQRVCRDPQRKLGEYDRLVGLMRLATEVGVAPKRMGLGAAAALRYLDPAMRAQEAAAKLSGVWGRPVDGSDEVLGHIERALAWLEDWQRSKQTFDTYLEP